MESDKLQPDKSKKRPHENYAKYSALGFEMLGAVLGGFFIGYFIDEYTPGQKRIWTAIMIPLFTVATLIRIIVAVVNESNKG